MAEIIYFFGFAAIGNNPTGFFKYEDIDQKLADTHYGFRKTNENALKEVVKLQGKTGSIYKINTEEGCFQVIPDN